ncbi:MAG: hypothetical protein Kow00123_02140 [Anaerolineales bacterium]
MSALEVLTGFVFETARDVLKELVKSAVEKKLNKIVEEQVREAIIAYLSQKPSQEIHVHIEVKTIDIFLQEVYAIASASNELNVKGNTIEIQRAPLNKIPETIWEMQLRQRVSDIRSEVNEIVRQDQAPEHESVNLSPRSPEPSERPLIFEDGDSALTRERVHQDVKEITQKYKNRIRSIIDKETSE